jgi:hypothetical protein
VYLESRDIVSWTVANWNGCCERSRHAPDHPPKSAKFSLSRYANFTQQRVAIYGQDARMKIRMTTVLRLWVDVEYQRIKNQDFTRTRAQLIPQILRDFEEAGDAMRYLNTKGEIAWKPTPGMLSRLADAEQEAIDDMED